MHTKEATRPGKDSGKHGHTETVTQTAVTQTVVPHGPRFLHAVPQPRSQQDTVTHNYGHTTCNHTTEVTTKYGSTQLQSHTRSHNKIRSHTTTVTQCAVTKTTVKHRTVSTVSHRPRFL